jgi:hypothetical protein
MKGRQQQSPAQPPDAASPFFARFLEDQHGGDAGARAAAENKTLKYPSDRDEIDWVLQPEAAANESGPSRMTLKYPSDRDEIDFHSS